jgi:hypothetical protein
MSFTVKFWAELRTKRGSGHLSADPMLTKVVILPAAPFIGLRVTDQDGNFDEEVKDIAYDVESDVWDVSGEPDYAIADGEDRNTVIERYLDAGWELLPPIEPRPTPEASHDHD